MWRSCWSFPTRKRLGIWGKMQRKCIWSDNDISMQSYITIPRCHFIPAGSILQRIVLPTLSRIGGHIAIVAGIFRHVKTDCTGWRDTLQWPSQWCHRWLYCALSLLRTRAVHLRSWNRTCHFEVSRWTPSGGESSILQTKRANTARGDNPTLELFISW